MVITLPLKENKDFLVKAFLGFAWYPINALVLDDEYEEYELDNTFTLELSESISWAKSQMKCILIPFHLACQLIVHGDEFEMGDYIYFSDLYEYFYNGGVLD